MKNAPKLLVLLLVTTLWACHAAAASPDGVEFRPIFRFVREALEGFLGQALSLSFFIIGVVYGVMRGSAVPAIIGIFSAALVSLGPVLIRTIFLFN